MYKKNILVITTEGNDDLDVALAPRFFRETVPEGGQFFEATFSDLFIQVGDGNFLIVDQKNNLNLSEFDIVFIRGTRGFSKVADAVFAVCEYLKLNSKTKVLNNFERKTMSKLAQAVKFHINNVPIAKTTYLSRSVMNSLDSLGVTFPCIMKAANAAHGEYNYVVNDVHEVEKYQNENKEQAFILQRLIPNNGDFRLLLLGQEKLLIGRKSTSKKNHLNNTSQGGSAELLPLSYLPKSAIKDAELISKAFGMDLVGIDIIIDKYTGEYSFLEVNSQPQLATGAFVQEKKDMVSKFLRNQ